MRDSDVIAFARSNLERVEGVYGGPAYRCAAALNDGLFLPCVVIGSMEPLVVLAKRRFEQTQLPEDQQKIRGQSYHELVGSFVAKGNRINSFDIARIEKSRFAIPMAKLEKAGGETCMGWTQFTAIMRDGREFRFGTTFINEFFQMPDGYSGDDVADIIPYVDGSPYFSEEKVPLYRERPYFNCFVKSL